MSIKREQALYAELLEEFGEDYIFGYARYVRCMTEIFVNDRFLVQRVFVDDHLLMQSILDALTDIKRLKHFHGIDYVNREKLNAYIASWFLRRKPIQRLQSQHKNPLFVNELFVLDFLLKSLSHALTDVHYYSREKASELVDHLFYHLKYRNTNPQTLELFMMGLNTITD